MNGVLEALYAKYQQDRVFAPLRGRTPFVPGEGRDKYPLALIVGEAPGATEERLRRPFVGQSGRLLRTALGDAGFVVARDTWITNILKYRPPGNRTPTPVEIRAARPYILREIAAILPEIVVPVGRVALTCLIPKYHGTMTSAHGTLISKGHSSYFPVIHPAAVLRGSAHDRLAWRRAFHDLRGLLG